MWSNQSNSKWDGDNAKRPMKMKICITCSKFWGDISASIGELVSSSAIFLLKVCRLASQGCPTASLNNNVEEGKPWTGRVVSALQLLLKNENLCTSLEPVLRLPQHSGQQEHSVHIPSFLFLANWQKRRGTIRKTLISLQVPEKTPSALYSHPCILVPYEPCLCFYHDYHWK